MARLVLIILLGYLAVLALTYIFQRSLQYFPPSSTPGTPASRDLSLMKEIKVTTRDGLQLFAWYAPPEKEGGRVVILFHGNAGHIGDRAIKARYLLSRGYGVYMCEYRGYGGNPGRPSEQGFYYDARAAIDWVLEQGYSASKIVLYGESIGTGVAVQMAVEYQPALLILEAPFSSAADVAKTAYPFLPVDWLMKDRYDSIDKIGSIKSPLLIIHGDEDRVVDIALGRRLFERANHPKEFININGGGHSDLYEHHAGHLILDWLDKQGRP